MRFSDLMILIVTSLTILFLISYSVMEQRKVLQELQICVSTIDSIADARQDSIMVMDSMIARLKGSYIYEEGTK